MRVLRQVPKGFKAFTRGSYTGSFGVSTTVCGFLAAWSCSFRVWVAGVEGRASRLGGLAARGLHRVWDFGRRVLGSGSRV